MFGIVMLEKVLIFKTVKSTYGHKLLLVYKFQTGITFKLFLVNNFNLYKIQSIFLIFKLSILSI